jgi:cobalt-zinc-cadmium efflux system outer membrane protein
MEPRRLEGVLDGQLPELEWGSALVRLLTNSPEVVKSHAEVERARSVLARESAGRTPNFEVAGAVLYNSASESTVASVGVAVPLQLFDRNQGNIHRAGVELAAAHQEVRRVALSLQDRLANAFKHYATARQQVERYRREILPDAKDSLDLVRQGYRHGEFGYLELLTAQRTYFQTSLAYVDALSELWVSATRIEGMLLEGGLDRPSE